MAAWEQRLAKLAGFEARRAKLGAEEAADAVQDAWRLFLLKSSLGALPPGSRPVGAAERLVLRNILRERRRSSSRWHRRNRPWCAVAEQSPAASAPGHHDDFPRLAQPLLDVARLLRECYEPEDIARILTVDVEEVTRRAAWIVLRRSEAGAALPPHLGLKPCSLGRLPRRLRQVVLRALHAVRWPRQLMARELCISVKTLQKALERGDSAAPRR